MWKWHGKYYLGAAHGFAGILYILLQFSYVTSNSEYLKLLTDSFTTLLPKIQRSDGQFTSSRIDLLLLFYADDDNNNNENDTDDD
jgi:lantibiotic modifying enzyme